MVLQSKGGAPLNWIPVLGPPGSINERSRGVKAGLGCIVFFTGWSKYIFWFAACPSNLAKVSFLRVVVAGCLT